jgi:hypothetical protein
LKGYCIKELIKKGVLIEDWHGGQRVYMLSPSGQAYAEQKGILPRHRQSVSRRSSSASGYFQPFPPETRNAASRFFNLLPKVQGILNSPHRVEYIMELNNLLNEMSDRLTLLLQQSGTHGGQSGFFEGPFDNDHNRDGVLG